MPSSEDHTTDALTQLRRWHEASEEAVLMGGDPDYQGMLQAAQVSALLAVVAELRLTNHLIDEAHTTFDHFIGHYQKANGSAGGDD